MYWGGIFQEKKKRKMDLGSLTSTLSPNPFLKLKNDKTHS
jgi:hypothetical protein